MKTQTNKPTMKTQTYIDVIETDMSDGIDIIHTWKNTKEAIKSGRFDYELENGDITEKEFKELAKLPLEKFIEEWGHPFSICK